MAFLRGCYHQILRPRGRFAKFTGGPFARMREQDQHLQIPKWRAAKASVFRKHVPDQNDAPVPSQRMRAVRKYPNALFVVLIVNDLLEDMDIGWRNSLEEITFDNLTSR
jgi:hypothetical protein